MIEFLVDKLHDARFMTMLLAAIAVSATAYTLIMPLFAGEGLQKRMKAVASERERIRQRERDRLTKNEKVSLRATPKQLVSRVVEDFNLTKWLAQEAARDKLTILGKTPAEIARLESAREVDGIHAETTLHAPIGGVIASRSVAVGQFIASGAAAPAFVITDPGSVWLIAQVPETVSAQVQLGDAVTVTTPAFPGREFAARIDNIGASLDPATHRLPVRATIRNRDQALKPQMFASFTIRSRSESGEGGVSVPASAVIHEGDIARVWVAGTGRTVRARNVILGSSSDGVVQVTSGLRAGEHVVTAGTIFVNEAGLPS